MPTALNQLAGVGPSSLTGPAATAEGEDLYTEVADVMSAEALDITWPMLTFPVLFAMEGGSVWSAVQDVGVGISARKGLAGRHCMLRAGPDSDALDGFCLYLSVFALDLLCI